MIILQYRFKFKWKIKLYESIIRLQNGKNKYFDWIEESKLVKNGGKRFAIINIYFHREILCFKI